MDLRDKLRHFESIANLPSQKTKKDSPKTRATGPGEAVINPFGTCLRIRTQYPVSHLHGRIPLHQFNDVDSSIFELVGKDTALNQVDFSRAIFLDTETTGLAGGAGTVPFLVGLGYFQEGHFIIDQYFMRDYDEEHALLAFVADHIQSGGPLVTYNGKGYDVHVLLSRWTLARMAVDIACVPHLDLLYPVRRLWKRRLRDCSLINVEKTILHCQRVNDVPGFLIPGLFFDFLRTASYPSLEPVFEHNRLDILSLVCLTGLMGSIFHNPLEILSDSDDFFSLGRSMENSGQNTFSIQCYRKALETVQQEKNWLEIAMHLGLTLKREKAWTEAVAVWQAILERRPDKIEVYEELAKYYEHRTRAYEKAIEFVIRAIERIQVVQELRDDLSMIFWKDRLAYRLNRLEMKKGSF